MREIFGWAGKKVGAMGPIWETGIGHRERGGHGNNWKNEHIEIAAAPLPNFRST